MSVDENTLNLVFNKIESGNIFTDEFSSFNERNKIIFSSAGIAIIYGPNGAGKTSLAKALSGIDGTKIEFEYCGKPYTSGNEVFSIINDQNHRNIIQGSPKDFLLGANIRKEEELLEKINKEYSMLCDKLIVELKNIFNITTKTNKVIDLLKNEQLKKVVTALANNQDKGRKIDKADYIKAIESITAPDEIDCDENKFDYLVKDIAAPKSVVESVLAIQEVIKTPKVRQIEENIAALGILNTYMDKTECIVCDTKDIDPLRLIADKTENKRTVIASLSKEMRELIDKIIGLVDGNDPFSIKETLIEALDSGDVGKVILLQGQLKEYLSIVVARIEKIFIDMNAESELSTSFEEYQKLLGEKIELGEEDVLFIQEIISGSMNKELLVKRDVNKNIKIFLGDGEFLGKQRDEVGLSTGEQNFLSLAFEFLRAKNSPQPIVVLDDPISSFDSIYKNKAVYAIAKILKDKKRIILTHNVDLIRLLEAQYKKCYYLYLLNNTEGELNGFIPLKYTESDMLINTVTLLEAFRSNTFIESIKDEELFLMAMIPFMRGYANICNNKAVYDELTKVMHGYMAEAVDIAPIYHELFDTIDDKGQVESCNIGDALIVDVEKIVKCDENKEIVEEENYCLLNRTLKHTLTYLKLRLTVEQALINKFDIDTSSPLQLGQIIDKAFPEDTDRNIKMRVRLTSKKTLINEFNHFEGNLSIFQPAIDITDCALLKEKNEILGIVDEINAWVI